MDMNCTMSYIERLFKFNRYARGGGGGTQIGSDGGVPLKPPNLYPSLRVILAEKGTHYQGFLFKKMTFLCTLATKWAKISSIYSKITKLHMFRDFSAKPYLIVRDFFAKTVTHLSVTPPPRIPYQASTPRPPPPPPGPL